MFCGEWQCVYVEILYLYLEYSHQASHTCIKRLYYSSHLFFSPFSPFSLLRSVWCRGRGVLHSRYGNFIPDFVLLFVEKDTSDSPPDVSSISRFSCSRFRHSYWNSFVRKRKKNFTDIFSNCSKLAHCSQISTSNDHKRRIPENCCHSLQIPWVVIITQSELIGWL